MVILVLLNKRVAVPEIGACVETESPQKQEDNMHHEKNVGVDDDDDI